MDAQEDTLQGSREGRAHHPSLPSHGCYRGPGSKGVSGTQWSARPPRPVPAGRAWRL